MAKKIFTLNNIAYGISFILVDLAVYVVLGLLLMGYDDFYDESKGALWSLESMTTFEKAIYIGLHIWHIINVLVIGYVIYRVVKAWRNNVLQQNL
jgi:hypothetical protein